MKQLLRGAASGIGALAAGPGAASARDELARSVRRRRCSRRQHQAGGVRGRRGIDCRLVRPSGAARVEDTEANVNDADFDLHSTTSEPELPAPVRAPAARREPGGRVDWGRER